VRFYLRPLRPKEDNFSERTYRFLEFRQRALYEKAIQKQTAGESRTLNFHPTGLPLHHSHLPVGSLRL
jgi:hypothetical protein